MAILNNKIPTLENEISAQNNVIKDLKTEIKDMKTEMVEQKKEMVEQKKEISTLMKRERVKRARLISGSIAYAYISRLNEECSQKDEMFSVLADNEANLTKIIYYFRNTELKNSKSLLEVDRILKELKKLRYEDAHPTRLNEEDENNDESEPPTTQQLIDQLKLVWGAKKRKKDLQIAIAIVEALNELSAHHGKEILDLSS